MPTLICDRPPALEQVKYYTIAGLPGDPTSPLSDNPDYGVEHDLGEIEPGSYSIRVSACNDWKCSLPTPFDFTVPDTPSQPLNLDITST